MAATQQPSNPAGDGVDISVQRARGARFGRPVFTVLIVSLVLVVIAFAVAFMTNSTNPVAKNGGQVEQPSVVQQFHEPEPAPKQPG
jgi:hypothetical protein